MDLEAVMLSEIRQTETYMLNLKAWNSQKQIVEWQLPEFRGGGNVKMLGKGYRFSLIR